MSTTDQERTEQYAEGIAETVRTLETLATVDLTDPDELAELDGSELTTLVEVIDFPARLDYFRTAGTVAYEALAEHAAEYLEDHGGSIVETWLEGVLDIEATYRRSIGTAGDVDPDTIAVVVTVGGPDARVYLDDIDGRARIDVQWWGSSARRYLHAPNLAARVYELEEITREAIR